jgi:DNA-binding CsgD family transcriptional regulator/tetratricopeptide (TPR) repeat protein
MAGISRAVSSDQGEAILTTAALVDREREVSRLRRAVDSVARGNGRAVVIEGSSGTGKTRLIEVAWAAAGAAGLQVRALTAMPDAAAAVDELGRAVEAALGRGPTALVVDDAHRLDIRSARQIRLAAARLGDAPLLLVVARRQEGDQPSQRVLDELRGQRGVGRLRPAALSLAGIRVLAVDRFGEQDEVDALAEACLWATGGHPFSVAELLAELRAGTAAAGDAAVRARTATPASVRRRVAVHLDRLSPEGRALARAIAVLAPEAMGERCAEVAKLDGGRAAAAARELEGEGLDLDSSGLSLRHRLVRAAVLAALDTGDRTDLVMRAATTRSRARTLEVVHPVEHDPCSAPPLGAAMRALLDGRPAAVAAGLAARALASDAGEATLDGIVVLACCGEHDAARAELAEARTDLALAPTERRGRVAVVAARVELAAGRLNDALEEASRAVGVAPHDSAGLVLGDVLLALESATEADVALRRLASAGVRSEQPRTALACARARIALGGRRSGLRELLEAAERLGPHARNESYLPWREDAVACLAADGRLDEAAALAEVGLANQRAFGEPVGLARALMATARVVRQPMDALEEAVELLRGTPNAHERARAELALGARLTAAGRLAAARERLAAGARDAAVAGSPHLARRIVDALTAAGGRPRAVLLRPADALTPAEWRVARLATTGRTNRDIGEELFLTEKTVEGHLTSVYRKLGVRGRAALGAALRGRCARGTPQGGRRPTGGA